MQVSIGLLSFINYGVVMAFRIYCRHFQNSPPNRRHCPFGKDCFYQHLNPDGTIYIFPENTNVGKDFLVIPIIFVVVPAVPTLSLTVHVYHNTATPLDAA